MKPTIILDIETQSATNPNLGGLNPRVDKILSWAISYLDDRPAEFGFWQNSQERLREILFAPEGVILVAHNTKFDCAFLETAWGPLPETIELRDMVHLCWLLDENEENYKLATMVKKYCGHTMKGYGEYTQQRHLFEATEDVSQKCIQDVEWTKQLYKTRLTQLQHYPSLVKVFENLYSPLIRVVMEMEREGVCVDVPRLLAMRQQYQLRIKEYEAAARELGYYKGLNRPMEISKYLFEEKKLLPRSFMLDKPRKYRMKGKQLWKVDKEILYEYMEEDPLVKLKLEHSRFATVYKMFLNKWPTLLEDGKMYPSIFQVRSNKGTREKDVESGTDSGRWAMSNPNLLQLDKDSELRSLIVAPPGYKILYADLSQAELRVMAHATKDKELTNCYLNDLDLHSITCAKLGGISRALGKESNFGLGYGIGAFKFSRRVLVRSKGKIRITEEQAADIKSGWYSTYSGITPYKASIERQLAGSGYVETIVKRRRRLGELYKQEPGDALRVAVNATIQGSVSDIIGIALLNIRKRRDIRTKFLIQVYDSVVLLVPEEIVEQETKMLKDCLENSVTLSVPMKAQCGVGQNLQEAEKNAH